MITNKDILAKLLASENIHVVRAPMRTASFDIVSRTLNLPQWKDMTENIEDMLVGHEVGHALFTDMTYLQTENYGTLHGYLNIIEDVRIEKFMKNKYPGLRKSFLLGYKELNDRDFFEIKDKDVNKMLLIDRINIYYKCGINSGVKFTPEEMDFVRKVDRCDTLKHVQDLAKQIYEYTKTEVSLKKKQAAERGEMTAEDLEDMLEEALDDLDPDMVASMNMDNLDFEYDPYAEEDEKPVKELTAEQKENAKEFAAGTNKYTEPDFEVKEEELESQTERALKRRLEEVADESTRVETWVPEMALPTNDEVVISYKELFSLMGASYNEERGEEFRKSNLKRLDDFKTETGRVVNYLVKEFEMRKSADAYKRNTISKTGNLNINKLAVYQLTDDVFKRITITKDSKNHGMMFLLDWSGSMIDNIADTIKQLITLCMFCQRTQIPYQVFAFTNGFPFRGNLDYDGVYNNLHKNNYDEKTYKGFGYNKFNLLELYSSKMTTSEFNRMSEFMFASPWIWCKAMNMNSTPLNEALLYMANYLGEFKRANSVEKLTFITLTDGEGGGMSGYARTLSHRQSGYDAQGNWKSYTVINYLHDPVTKKDYKITQDSSVQTRVLLKLIKDRYDAKTIGFYIGRNSRRDLAWFVRNNAMTSNATEESNLVGILQTALRKEDFAYLTNCGRDEMYLLQSSKMAIQEGDLKVGGDMSSREIAKAFNKYLDVKKTNRVLLNRFVAQIA
jgi:hypothetical protein